MEQFYCRRLSKENLREVYNLHCATVDDLERKNKNVFLMPQDIEYFRWLLEHHLFLGLFNSDNILVGQSAAVYNPNNSLEHFKPFFKTGNIGDERLAILKSTCIHPGYQGRGLIRLINNELFSRVKMVLLSQVNIMNINSLSLRLGNGFVITDMKLYPTYECHYYNLIRLENCFDPTSGDDCKVYWQETDKIKQLLQEGYIGVDFDRNSKEILLKDGTSFRRMFGL